MSTDPAPKRKKNKELSKAEGIADAKADLAKYWFGSEPLFATVSSSQGVSLFPLSERIQKKYWLVSYFNPTDYTGETAIHYVSELSRRFQNFHVQFLSVLAAPYGFSKDPLHFEKYVKTSGISGISTLDYDGTLAELFAVEHIPKLILLHNGAIISAVEGPEAFLTVETEIHRQLRSSDPGLPLENVYRPVLLLPSNQTNIELGRLSHRHQTKPNFVGGHFGKMEERVTSGTFNAKNETVTDLGTIALSGHWHQNDECIYTSDSNASLRFTTYGAHFSLLARSLATGSDYSRIAISSKGTVIHDMYFSKDIIVDDDWGPIIRTKTPRLYYGLSRLPIDLREFTLHFPLAHRAAIALFGFRFCD